MYIPQLQHRDKLVHVTVKKELAYHSKDACSCKNIVKLTCPNPLSEFMPQHGTVGDL